MSELTDKVLSLLAQYNDTVEAVHVKKRADGSYFVGAIIREQSTDRGHQVIRITEGKTDKA